MGFQESCGLINIELQQKHRTESIQENAYVDLNSSSSCSRSSSSRSSSADDCKVNVLVIADVKEIETASKGALKE